MLPSAPRDRYPPHAARNRQGKHGDLREQHTTEFRGLTARQRAERELVAAAHPPRPLLLASRSVLCSETRRGDSRATRQAPQGAPAARKTVPTLDEWLPRNGLIDDLAQIRSRYRGSILGIEDHDEPPHPRDIRAFLAEVHGSTVNYHPGDHRVVFTDFGPRIDVHDGRDQTALTAALQLAAQKWTGGVTSLGWRHVVSGLRGNPHDWESVSPTAIWRT